MTSSFKWTTKFQNSVYKKVLDLQEKGVNDIFYGVGNISNFLDPVFLSLICEMLPVSILEKSLNSFEVTPHFLHLLIDAMYE